MVEIRPVEDRDELRRVFDLLGGQMHPPIDTSDFRFRDLPGVVGAGAVLDGRRSLRAFTPGWNEPETA